MCCISPMSAAVCPLYLFFCSFDSHPLCAMSSQPPPSEGSESSFWASVYTHEPPNVLCGVITDINLHRFTLHQHLTTHRALTETPLLHPPFQRAMPEALQTHLQLYTSSIQQIEVHVRRALTALDALGRHPPRVYLQELDSTLDDDSASEVLFPTADELLPGRTINLPPITRRNIGGTSPVARVLQHTSVQTTPTHSHNQSTQTDTTIETLRLHEEQQTTPYPEPWSAATQTDRLTSHATAQTELHSMVLSPDQLQAHSPAVAEGSAIRALKATSDDLARAREKLQAHGLELTPKKDTGPYSAPSNPAPPPPPHQPPALTDVLQPSYPTLKDDAPEAWTAPSIQQWMKSFEPKVQEAAQEILRLLQTSKVSTDQLKEAATRYGLPLIRVNKLSIKSLQHIVSVGAAIAC